MTDPLGQPAHGADALVIWAGSQRTGMRSLRLSLRLDPEGRASLLLPAGPWLFLAVQGEAWVTAQLDPGEQRARPPSRRCLS